MYSFLDETHMCPSMKAIMFEADRETMIRNYDLFFKN